MLIPSSLMQSMASFVSQNVGAGNEKRAKKTMIKTINEIRTSEFGDCDGKKDLYLDAAYTGDRKEAQEWLDELHEAFPEFEIRMDPLSLSVACHIGPGARAVTLTKILHVN